MKKVFTIILTQLLFSSMYGQNTCSGNYNSSLLKALPVNNPPYKAGWHFIHQEEFDGATDIDNYFWNKWEGNWRDYPGSSTGMFFKPSNISVNNGRCNLNVMYAPNTYSSWNGSYYYNYTSAFMHTKKEFGPGYFWEMKGKRNDVGFKSSFWSYNFNNTEDLPGETHHAGEGISFFDNHFSNVNDTRVNFSEVFGYDNNGIGCQANTWFNDNSNLGAVVPASNVTDHTYSLDYQSNEVKMYINNQLIIKNVTHVPQSTQQMGFWATNIYWGTNPTTNLPSNKMEIDYIRLYKKNEQVSTPLSDFCLNQGWTNQNVRPRFIADFNGDGKKDIIGFGYQNVKISLSNTTNKNVSILPYNDVILNQYTVEQGWNTQNDRPRLIGDINGDGKADIVAFGYVNAVASISNSNNSISFLPLQYLGAIYTKEQGWNTQNDYPRFLSDVNGDGKDDIIGFEYNGVSVSLSNATTNSATFLAKTLAINDFGIQQGYSNQSVRPRFLSDVNGDGKKDIIGFGNNSVFVSLSNCTATTISFLPPIACFNALTVEQGYTTQETRPRYLADINGDGKDDIVAFGTDNVYASISTCSGNTVTFTTPISVNSHFTVEQSFLNTNNNPRILCDINNDKKADIVGFRDDMIQISTSSSQGNTALFDTYNNFMDDMTNYKQWTDNNTYPRILSDVNGDGSVDLLGFGYNDITVSQNVGGTYNIPFTIFGSTKTTSDDWSGKGSTNIRDAAYKFYLNDTTDITASSCFPETNFWEILSIRDMNGNLKGYLNTGEFNINCQLTPKLPPGYYYIIIDGYNGTNGNYSSIGEYKLVVTGISHPHKIGNFNTIKNEPIFNNDFNVFPNPNNGSFVLKIENENLLPATIELIDVYGKTLITDIQNEENKNLNLELSSGFYFVKTIMKDRSVQIKKIIIEK